MMGNLKHVSFIRSHILHRVLEMISMLSNIEGDERLHNLNRDQDSMQRNYLCAAFYPLDQKKTAQYIDKVDSRDMDIK